MSGEVGGSTSKTFETNCALFLHVFLGFLYFLNQKGIALKPFSILLFAALEMDVLINQLGGKFVVYHLLIFIFYLAVYQLLSYLYAAA